MTTESGKYLAWILIMSRNELIHMVDRLDREGGFAKALGQACLLADEDNLRKLMRTFPEIFYKVKVIK
jgi:hypothetical protein